MPFSLKKYKAIVGEKIQLFLINEAGLSSSVSQKLLSKNRVFDDQGGTLKNGQIITGEYVQIAVFEGSTRGLKPIFEADDFVVFDKPSGLMVHPTKKTTPYCLLDEVRYQFGEKADLVHRIDTETSGLVLVAKNKPASTVLKTMFENKEYAKEYLALVKGDLQTDITIDKSIAKADGSISIKMQCGVKNGKESITHVYPQKFIKKHNATLVRVVPITGRQHQIRVHLDSAGYPIVGDPMYGVSEETTEKYLNKTLTNKQRFELTGGDRLMLHANNLSFVYKGEKHNIVSKFSKFYE